MEEPFIILNRIRTPDGTVLTSHHRHDYKSHMDENGEVYVVDGGSHYLRRSVNNEPYEDLTVYSDEPYEKIRRSLYRGSRGKDGNEPLHHVRMDHMSNDYLEALLDFMREDNIFRKFYEREVEYREEHGISISEDEQKTAEETG